MRIKRLLCAALACALLAGCGPVRTEPEQAGTVDAPSGSEKVIAYVPLDDRPDNEERVVYLAESLGYALTMPERDLYHTALDDQPVNANGTQSGDRGALFAWVLEQEAAGCDRYVLSMDQILSGGLVRQDSPLYAMLKDKLLQPGSGISEITALQVHPAVASAALALHHAGLEGAVEALLDHAKGWQL